LKEIVDEISAKQVELGESVIGWRAAAKIIAMTKNVPTEELPPKIDRSKVKMIIPSRNGTIPYSLPIWLHH
jgi:hypothetical protein